MEEAALPTTKEQLDAHLRPYEQEQLLRFWDRLDVDQREHLAQQIMGIDFDQIRELNLGKDHKQDFEQLAAQAGSPPAFRLGDDQARHSPQQARIKAEGALAAGKLGVVLVAGGQGTRLGFPHPKGMFHLGPVSDRTLFQIHIDGLKSVASRFGTRIPLYLMTSPATHDETVEFLDRHERFGLPREDLHIFCQGTMPAVDGSARLILEKPGRVFLSPDGHGGMLAAFDKSGCLADAKQRGLEHLFYFQVDNPLVEICDRELVGYHLLSDSDMTTQVVAKTAPDDKVGNVVAVNGRLMVIEYSDLPAAAGERRQGDGSLELWAGSIAVHVFRLDFLAQALKHPDALPFHRAHKKVPFVNDDGETVEPEAPNATKFERFIFDLMPVAKNAIVVEAAEEEAFAPLKNASGADKDTPETSRAAIVSRDRRRLEQTGVLVDDGVSVEISPLFALDTEELTQRVTAGQRIKEDTFLQ